MYPCGITSNTTLICRDVSASPEHRLTLKWYAPIKVGTPPQALYVLSPEHVPMVSGKHSSHS